MFPTAAFADDTPAELSEPLEIAEPIDEGMVIDNELVDIMQMPEEEIYVDPAEEPVEEPEEIPEPVEEAEKISELTEDPAEEAELEEESEDELLSAAGIIASGKSGENLTWKLDDEGTLTISGKGYMEYIGDWSAHYSRIKTVVIEDGVKSIYSSAFECCVNLENVTIPGSVVIIGDGAFFECKKLAEIVLSAGLKQIGTQMFVNCTSLSDVVIPDTVTSIGEGAFYNCNAFDEITIPSGVTSIGSYAFFGCSHLSDVYYDGTEQQWLNIEKGDCNSELTESNVHCKPSVDAPTGLTNSDSGSSGKPIVKWTTVSGATKYDVYRATSESGTYTLIKTATTNSYTDTTATAGDTYYYKVKAYSSTGTTYASAYSAAVNAKAEK